MMHRAITYILCAAGMTGFYFAARFLITGISSDFGDGVAVGVAVTIILFWLSEKIERARGRP